MAASGRTLLRRQLAVLGVVAVVAAAGAFIWSRSVADNGDGGDVINLGTPGEFVDPASTNPEHSGELLPVFDLVNADGDTVRLEPDGRPMVVNLWYSTCPPCSRELTAFGAVEDDLGDDVQFVGVNPLDDAETMIRYAADRGVDYLLLRDPDEVVGSSLGVLQYPVTLFVSAEGGIVAQTGALSEDELRSYVAELLA